MILRISDNAIVFSIDDLNSDCDSKEIRERAILLLAQQGICADGDLEVQSFIYGQHTIVFATYIRQRDCCEIYRFNSIADLLDAYTSHNRIIKGCLIEYEGQYYAAVFEQCNHTLYEYADKLTNGNCLYTFLAEHGIIKSENSVFS